MAKSFNEFATISLRSDLSNLTAMLGNDKFTEIYFRTEYGNIYKIYQNLEKKWILSHKKNPKYEYQLIDAEMYYGRIRTGEMFFYGNGNHSSNVIEIICVNTSKLYNMINLPEAKIYYEYNDK
jgi:hypothetical protein